MAPLRKLERGLASRGPGADDQRIDGFAAGHARAKEGKILNVRSRWKREGIGMALQDEPVLWLALLVAVVAALLMRNLSRRSRTPAADAAASGPPAEEMMLLKFLVDENGVRRGETVALEGEGFVVKSGDAFYIVPKVLVADAGAQLALKGPLDWEAARREGDAWRERSHKVITYKEEELPKDEA